MRQGNLQKSQTGPISSTAVASEPVTPARRLPWWRIAASGLLLGGLCVFLYWFAVVPYAAPAPKRVFQKGAVERADPAQTPDHGDVQYPPLDGPQPRTPVQRLHPGRPKETPHSTANGARSGKNALSPARKPDSRNTARENPDKKQTTPRRGRRSRPANHSRKSGSRLDLFSYLPADSLLYVSVDLKRLKKAPWIVAVLKGKQLAWLSATAAALGFDLQRIDRLAAAFEVRSSVSVSFHNLTSSWRKWRRALKRPLCVAASGTVDRQKTLQLFRKKGPLTASLILGRRVYHRDPGFALALPRPGLVLSTYRRPMATLLGLYAGRSTRSARKGVPGKRLAAMRKLAGPKNALLVVSNNTAKNGKGGVSVPGGGRIEQAGLAVAISASGLRFRWQLQLDTPVHARRFARRAQRLTQALRRYSWARRSGLSKAVAAIKITASGATIRAKTRLPHTSCALLLESIAE